MPAIAITDHGVTYGLVEFVSEAQRLGIKPIVGVEGYQAQRIERNEKAIRIKNHFTSFYLLKTPLALELEHIAYESLFRRLLLQTQI